MGFMAGIFTYGHIDLSAGVTVIGAGLGASISVWGALAAVSHQAKLRERDFKRLAIEAARSIREDAEYAEAMIQSYIRQKEGREKRIYKHIVRQQLERLLETSAVFTEHVATAITGEFHLRRAILQLQVEICSARKTLSSDRYLDEFDSGGNSKDFRVSIVQRKSEEFLTTMGARWERISEHDLKKREGELRNPFFRD